MLEFSPERAFTARDVRVTKGDVSGQNTLATGTCAAGSQDNTTVTEPLTATFTATDTTLTGAFRAGGKRSTGRAMCGTVTQHEEVRWCRVL